MSRMHALGLTLAVAAAVCWPPPAIQAQQTEAPGVQERDTRPTEEELVSRIEALWPQLEQARVEALEARRRKKS